MPSNEISFPGAYLLGLLAGGARPFSYRSGVYRLLGATPQAEHRMSFLPPMPPAGFQYEEHRRLPFSPGPSAPALLSGGSSRMPQNGASGGGGRREREATLPFEEKVAQRIPAAVQPAEQEKAVPARASRTMPSTTPLDRSQDAPAPPATRSETPAPEPERPRDRPVGVSLPGLTRQRSSFAMPAAALQGEAVPPVEEQPSEEQPSPTSLYSLDPPRFDAPVDERKNDAASAGFERAAGATPAQPAPVRGAMKPRPRLAPRVGVEAGSYGVTSAERPLPPRGAVDEPGQPEAAWPVLQSRTRASAAVENIRRAATKQAARQAPAPEAPLPEPRPAPAQPAPAQPAPQPVVIVRPAPSVRRWVPRAFWAGSTLRSTHLRMLR